MNQIDLLLKNYEEFVTLPWSAGLSGAQRVWFAVYEKGDERRLRTRIGEFELATRKARHDWHLADVTDEFAAWMGSHEYREAYFADPKEFDATVADFRDHLAQKLRDQLARAGDKAVFGILGVGTLFGILSVAELISTIRASIGGRLLVFFPGQHEANVYRLLDATDGYDYLAVPITAYKGAPS